MSELEILKNLVMELCINPNEVRVEQKLDDRGVLLTLFVSNEDKPHIIGKDGNKIGALRTIFHSLGMRRQKHISIVVDDPNRNTQAHTTKRRDVDDFGVSYGDKR